MMRNSLTNRRQIASLLLATGAILALPSFATSQPTMYFKEGDASLQLIAIGKITPDTVECWNAAGEQTEQVSSKLRDALVAESLVQLPVSPGMKTRFLLLRARGLNCYSGPGTKHVWTVPAERWLDVNPETLYVLLACTVENGEAYASPTLVAQVAEKPTLILPFKKGAKCSARGLSFELGPIEDLYGWNPLWGGPFEGSSCRFTIGCERSAGCDLQAVYYPVDKKGNQIVLVANGKPLKGNVITDAMPHSSYVNFMIDTSGLNVPGAAKYWTNIDKKYIGGIQVFLKRQIDVCLRHIPMDPSH